MAKFSRFLKDESGATAIEYGLLAAILAIGIITVLQSVRSELQTTFTTVETELSSANAQ